MTADNVVPPPQMITRASESESNDWATLRLRCDLAGTSRADLDRMREQLDTLGGLLMLEADVGGVEVRDPASSPDAPPLELVVYTVPRALPTLKENAARWAAELQLRVAIEESVHHGEDWKDTWKQFYRPIVFGNNTLLVRPSWLERPSDAPARELIIDPGRAFGTGLHETTHLCLEWLCARHEAGYRPARMLDLGCGSGILSLGAAVLFPTLTEIVAVDVDPEAVETTRENAEINGLTERLQARTGALAELEGERFDLIIANIRSEVLLPIAADLRRNIDSGGRLVLSGVLDLERERIESTYQAAGWTLDSSHALGSWVAFGWSASG